MMRHLPIESKTIENNSIENKTKKLLNYNYYNLHKYNKLQYHKYHKHHKFYIEHHKLHYMHRIEMFLIAYSLSQKI